MSAQVNVMLGVSPSSVKLRINFGGRTVVVAARIKVGRPYLPLRPDGLITTVAMPW